MKYTDFIFLNGCYGKYLTPIWFKSNFFGY